MSHYSDTSFSSGNNGPWEIIWVTRFAQSKVVRQITHVANGSRRSVKKGLRLGGYLASLGEKWSVRERASRATKWSVGEPLTFHPGFATIVINWRSLHVFLR